MHGGTLQLDSDIGKGTTFTVRMPGAMDKPDEVPAAKAANVTTAESKQAEKTDAA